MGKKYVIELEDEPITNGLWKVKGFNSLVFDKNGLDKLTPFNEVISVGDIVREGCIVFTVFYAGLNAVEGFDSDMNWHTSSQCNVVKVAHNHEVAAFMARRGKG